MQAIIADIGQFSLLLAFGFSCYALASSFVGGKAGHRRLVETAERSVLVVFGLVTLTIITMWYQLMVGNFGLFFVASNSNRAMPWFYKIGALWGGQEGSLLFWC